MHRDATDITTRIATYGDAVRVRINESMAIPTRNMSHPESPSLYSIKMKPTYTRADPVSLCRTMIIIGRRIINAVIMKSLALPIL